MEIMPSKEEIVKKMLSSLLNSKHTNPLIEEWSACVTDSKDIIFVTPLQRYRFTPITARKIADLLYKRAEETQL